MNIQMLTGFALSVSPDTKYQMFSPEAWSKAFEVTVLGMGMIFAVLTTLWAVLAIFKLLFAKDSKPVNKEPAKEPTVQAEPEMAPTVGSEPDDAELVAVITAAIAAYRAAEEGKDAADVGGFRVVSFKRAVSGRAWNSNK